MAVETQGGLRTGTHARQGRKSAGLRLPGLVLAAGLVGLGPWGSGGLQGRAAAQETESPAQEAQAADVRTTEQPVTVGRGGSFATLLGEAGVPAAETDAAVKALGTVFDVRRLQIGQGVSLKFQEGTDGRRFAGLQFRPEPGTLISLGRLPEKGFKAERVDLPVERKLVSASATIRSSLYEAGLEAGIPVPVLLAAIRSYSYEVDFQRDFQAGDQFEVLFERFVTAEGKVAREGQVLFARLRLGKRDLPIYRHQTRDGKADYYNAAGESIRKALLRTPIDGARLTSGFGMRHHPILGYSKMHKGADFGAPTGTPVYAAGNGVLESVGRNGAYGNYVRVRHNSEIATGYGHLSRFAAGLHRGSRVDQGEVIAYVGSTGRSTGPHLHYEVLRGGHQVNPLTVDLPTGRKLNGRDLEEFQAARAQTDQTFTDTQRGWLLAGGAAAQVAAQVAGQVVGQNCSNEFGC